MLARVMTILETSIDKVVIIDRIRVTRRLASPQSRNRQQK